jgi:phosphoglucosamine mutase
VAGKLFGTDGVRGVAGEFLTAELALALGRAATERTTAPAPRVLIVRDTRESGEMLEAAVAAGVSAGGGEALLGGVLPTPAAPLLLLRYQLDLAVVLSASHNPYRDNGIKFFGGDGYKLDDQEEAAIEARLEHDSAASAATAPAAEPRAESAAAPRAESAAAPRAGSAAAPRAGSATAAAHFAPATGPIGRIRELRGAAEDYLRELHTRFSELDLRGLNVLLDCANGATYHVAPEIFRRLGATVTVLADTPDGRNINDGCGSTHIDALAARMLDGGHDAGFAFDGDGDRVLAVDARGTVVDGDELMALAALHLRRAGALTGGVAVTVMTNFGFHAAMQEAGVDVAVTQVGDRYVLEALREREWMLGGEQSGHLIDMRFNATGDGIASALLTIEALEGGKLSERDAMHKLPQQLVNVRVRDRDALAGSGSVAEAIQHAESQLAGRGRVLVRPSGTEPLVRVMVEAPSEAEAAEVCERLVARVEAEIGG